MDRSQYAPMMPSNEGPNPLRPYYRPPSIGERAIDSTPNFTTPTSTASAVKSSPSFGSSARDILSDLNYGDVFGDSAPSTGASVRSLFDQALWKYSSIFMAQPFEVAKMILQCRITGTSSTNAGVHDSFKSKSSIHHHRSAVHEPYTSEEDDDEEPSYFTSVTPQYSETPQTPSIRSRSSRSRTPPSSRPRPPSYKLELRRPHSISEVLAQLWQREGAWGVWKGTNVTFLYSLLLKTLETWTRSMFSALFNLPDPGFITDVGGGVGGLDILDSPSPLASLGVAVVAASVAGLLLAPLDIVRTRLMLVSVTDQPRSIIPCLRNLHSWICPTSLMPTVLIHSALPTLISTSTPLLLRTYLRVDPIITPLSYSVCTFFSSVADLFITLPFETVLRRGQINLAAETDSTGGKVERSRSRSRRRSRSTEKDSNLALSTVVDVGPYNGIVGTMWRIIYEEGQTYEKTAATTRGAIGTHAHRPVYASKKGQGVQGLWRGWRVGMWGLVGVWGAAALGAGNNKGGEF